MCEAPPGGPGGAFLAAAPFPGNSAWTRRSPRPETERTGKRPSFTELKIVESKQFAAEFCREINRLRAAEAAKTDQAKAELAMVERSLRRIVEAIAEGAPVRTLKDGLISLEARQDELKQRIASTNETKPFIHPNLAELYRRKVADLATALEDEATRPEAMAIIRSLVDAIVLTPEKGELRIDLTGELAGILDLCAEGKNRKPGTREAAGLEAQVKLVVGTRNRRDFTLKVAV